MPQETFFPLTVRLTAGRLASSPLTVAAGAGLAVIPAWGGLIDSYETAVKLFLFLIPYAFLLAVRDGTMTDIECGRLENALFLQGRYKAFLWQKNFAAALAVGLYALGLFLVISASGLAVGRFDWGLVPGFGRSLAAGFYYVALAGLLGFRLKSGGNVAAVVLAQAAAAAALLFSMTARSGFIDLLAAGRFPGVTPKLLFAGLLAVFPQLIVAGSLAGGAVFVAAGALVLLGIQRIILRRLDLH